MHSLLARIKGEYLTLICPVQKHDTRMMTVYNFDLIRVHSHYLVETSFAAMQAVSTVQNNLPLI